MSSDHSGVFQVLGSFVKDWMRGVTAFGLSVFLSTPVKNYYRVKILNNLDHPTAIQRMRELVRLGGAGALWKGSTFSILGNFISTGSIFALKDFYNRWLFRRAIRDNKTMELSKYFGINFLSGALAGLTLGIFTIQTESRMAFSYKASSNAEASYFYKETVTTNEFWKLKLTAAVLTRAAYFGIYDTLAAPSMNRKTSFLTKLIYAEVAVLSSYLVGHPFERILQLLKMSKSGQVASEFMSLSYPMLANSIIRTEGFGGLLWRHLPHAYSSLTGAFCLAIYDCFKRYDHLDETNL